MLRVSFVWESEVSVGPQSDSLGTLWPWTWAMKDRMSLVVCSALNTWCCPLWMGGRWLLASVLCRSWVRYWSNRSLLVLPTETATEKHTIYNSRTQYNIQFHYCSSTITELLHFSNVKIACIQNVCIKNNLYRTIEFYKPNYNFIFKMGNDNLPFWLTGTPCYFRSTTTLIILYRYL